MRAEPPKTTIIGPSGTFYAIPALSAWWGDQTARARIQFAGSAETFYEVFDSAEERTDFLKEIARLHQAVWTQFTAISNANQE